MIMPIESELHPKKIGIGIGRLKLRVRHMYLTELESSS